MARVNKKLLIVVSIGAVLTVGVIGGVMALNWKGDPMRHIRNGDEAYALGDFRKAADFYDRAIGKRRSDQSFFVKYLDAASKVVPETPSEARERYLRYTGFMALQAQVARDDAALWETLLDELRLQGEVVDSPETWRGVADRIDSDMVSSLATDDPLLPLAVAYRGYAQAQRASSLAPEERRQVATEIEGILDAAKGKSLDLAYGALLRIAFSDARTLSNAGQVEQAAAAWKSFDELLAKAQAAGSGPTVARLAVERLAARRQAGDTAVTPEMMESACAKLAADALDSDDGLEVFNTWRTIGAANGVAGLAQGCAMLETYIERHPASIMHRHALARSLQVTDYEAAQKQARLVLDEPNLPVGFMSALQEELSVSSAMQIFDIEFIRFSEAADDAERSASLERMAKALDELEGITKGTSTNVVVTKAEGKLLFAKGDYVNAGQKFNELMKAGALVDAELYVLASLTAERQGMSGLALQYANSGLDLAPGNIDLYLRKASLELQLAKYDDAFRTASALVAADPENTLAKDILARADEGRKPLAVDDRDPIIQKLAEAEQAFQAKDYAKSDAILTPLLEENPENIGLIIAMARLRFVQGNQAEAEELCDRALAINPNHPTVRQVTVFIKATDPVQRVLTMVELQHPEGPDRIAWSYVRIGNLADRTEDGLAEIAKTDKPEAERQAALIPAMRAAEAKWKETALAADPTHPAILDFHFGRAVKAKDYATAAAIAAEAASSERDPALPFMLKARLAVEQRKFGEAVSTIQQAFDRNLDRGDMWRLRGYAQEQAGDLVAALNDYAEAYRRDPVDLNNIRAYVSTLIKSGNRQEALVVLRTARKAVPDAVDIEDLWIQLEYEIGDRRMARSVRETKHRLQPSNRRNSLSLATMLAETQPVREDVGDERGNLKYTELQWRGLDEETRQRELNSVRDIWRKQSDTIFAELLAADPRNPELALVRASTYRRQAKNAEAEATLRRMIDNAAGEATPSMWVALGLHYAESGDEAKATEAFAEAIKRESDETRDASSAIAEYYFQKAKWAKAIEYYERVAERQDSRTLSLRMAEAYGKLHRFDEARAKIDKAVAKGSRDIVVDQLEANLAEARGDDLRNNGDVDGAMKSYDEGLESLSRARAAMPNNAIIGVQEASLLRRQFDTTGNREKLTAAIAAADRATKLRADFWPAAQAKSELLLAVPDLLGSIAELERYVKAAPSSVEGRRRLVEMLAATGNISRANELVREAIGLAPGDPQWQVALGELLAQQGQLDGAILAYEQADRIRPDPSFLYRMTELRLRKSPPDWNAVLSSLRARNEEVKVSPYLQSAIAAALVGGGDQRRGLDAMRESYRAAKRQVLDNPTSVPNRMALDGWYANLRLVYQVSRAADAEKFVTEAADGKLSAQDYRWLAELWGATGPDGTSRAIECAERGIEVDDRLSPTLTARLFDIVGGAKYGLGDCAGALDAFTKAYAALPGEPTVLNNFAYVAADCGGDLKAAEAAAQRATHFAPNNPEFLDTYGYVLGKAGKLTQAKEALQRSLKFGESASAFFHLAEILAAEGNKEGARTYLRSAGDKGPDPSLQAKINELLEKVRD